jgi:hypothetical protein
MTKIITLSWMRYYKRKNPHIGYEASRLKMSLMGIERKKIALKVRLHSLEGRRMCRHLLAKLKCERNPLLISEFTVEAGCQCREIGMLSHLKSVTE